MRHTHLHTHCLKILDISRIAYHTHAATAVGKTNIMLPLNEELAKKIR